MKDIVIKISKVYIWLIPVTSVPLLYWVSRQTQTEIYLLIVGIHLLVTLLSLRLLTRSTKGEQDYPGNYQNIHSIIVCLILGATFAFVAATTFPGTELPAIASNKFGHYWTSSGFLISGLVSLAGFVQLTILLFKHHYSIPALSITSMTLGLILWILHLSFRVTVMVSAADGISVEGYQASAEWAGLMYAIYMVLTYIALAGFGFALYPTFIVPRWVSVLTISFGLVGPVMLAAGVQFFGMPLTIHLIPWLIGIHLINYQRNLI